MSLKCEIFDSNSLLRWCYGWVNPSICEVIILQSFARSKVTLVFICSLCWHLYLCILYTFGESAVLALMLQRSMVINMMGRAARLQTTDSRIFSNNTGIIAWMDTFILHERISLTVRIESNVTNIACWNCQSLIRKEIMWTEKSSVRADISDINVWRNL